MPNYTHSNYERDVVHPAIAKWLTDHGWQFEQEKQLSKQSRLDFLACNANGQFMIVEGKGNCESFGTTLKQILRYDQEYGKGVAHLAIAVPLHTITDRAVKDCNRLQIRLIGLDIPPIVYSFDAGLDLACKSLIAHSGEWMNTEYAKYIVRIFMSCNVPSARNYLDSLMSKIPEKEFVEMMDKEVRRIEQRKLLGDGK